MPNTKNKKKRRSQSNQNNQPRKKQKTNGISQKNKSKNKSKTITPFQSRQHCISWLLFNEQQISINDFFDNYFGKKHLLIQRNNPNYYNQHHIRLKLSDVHQIIKQNEIKFDQHIIAKSYDGNKEHNAPWIKPNENVSINAFKKIMQKGYTVQLHHPQHFVKNIAKILHLFESYFGVEVGSNVYITPNNKQGLAPHYDDVDIFILQIEGKKHWKLYEQTDEDNKYPLECSGDLDLSQIDDAKLLIECDLSPGDLLYFPRGTIHCAKTIGKGHSTHITISSHQKTTWADFMSTLMDKAMKDAMEKNVELRQNMPLNFLSFMGTSFEQSNDEKIKKKQQMFVSKINDLMKESLMKSVQNVVHKTCDLIGTDFVSHRLAPNFTLDSKNRKHGGNENVNVCEDDYVCLRSVDWIRVVDDDEMSDGESENEDDEDESEEKEHRKENLSEFMDDDDDDDMNGVDAEEGKFRLYSCVSNDRNLHCVQFEDESDEKNEGFIKLPLYLRPVVDSLINSYPNKQSVRSLFEECGKDSDVTLPEIQEFVQLLHDMQLIKITKG